MIQPNRFVFRWFRASGRFETRKVSFTAQIWLGSLESALNSEPAGEAINRTDPPLVSTCRKHRFEALAVAAEWYLGHRQCEKVCARHNDVETFCFSTESEIKFYSSRGKKEQTEKISRKVIWIQYSTSVIGRAVKFSKNFVVAGRKLKRGSFYVFIHKTRARPMLLMWTPRVFTPPANNCMFYCRASPNVEN